MLLHIGAKGAADQRNVPYDRDLIFSFLHVFPHQPAKHHRLAVINADTGRYLARAEHRVVNDVRCELDRLRNRYSSRGIDADCIARAAIIDETLESAKL